MSQLENDLQIVPSTLEVDYDKNLTDLYQAITDQKWDYAAQVCKTYPVQAATWVVRHYEDDDEIMWRFLPIHSACARQPPAFLIQALLKAYPDGAKCIDDQGMYALHYACGNQASRDVIRLLLVNFPDAAKLPDPRGMLPIHYLACWGPSSVAVVDMLLVAHRDVASARDDEGNTPLDLAKDGDYPERVAVMAALKKWLADKPSASKSNNNSRALTIHAHDEEEKKDCDDDDSFRVDALESQVRKLQTELQRKARGGNNNTAEESDTLSLQRKIRQLQGELELKEAEESHAHGYDDANSWKGNEEAHIWRKKFIALEKRYEEREHELLVENGKLMDDVHRAEKNLALAEESLDHRNRTTAEKDARIAELEKQIENSKAERDGLRMSLGDLMDKHDTFKKKSINLSDRLGSLSVSLESMMEQQAALTVAMKERNEQYQDVIRQRRTKLNELEELEAGMQKDETNLEKSLDKQMKEMEAIAAVIAATRN